MYVLILSVLTKLWWILKQKWVLNLLKYGLSKGHSLVIGDEAAESLYQELQRTVLNYQWICWWHYWYYITQLFSPGGWPLNTAGRNGQDIKIGSYGYHIYVIHQAEWIWTILQGVDSAIGRCFLKAKLLKTVNVLFLLTKKIKMNQLNPESILKKDFQKCFCFSINCLFSSL